MAFKFKIKIEKFPTRDCHSLPLSLLPSSKLWCKKKILLLNIRAGSLHTPSEKLHISDCMWTQKDEWQWSLSKQLNFPCGVSRRHPLNFLNKLRKLGLFISHCGRRRGTDVTRKCTVRGRERDDVEVKSLSILTELLSHLSCILSHCRCHSNTGAGPMCSEPRR